MFFVDIIRRSLRSLKNAKLRTLLTAFAIAVGAFALTLTLAASNGAQSYVNKIINDNFDPTELIVTKDANVFSTTDNTKPQEYNSSFGSITSPRGTLTQVQQLGDSDITELQAIPGVEKVRLASSASVSYITRPGVRKYIATVVTLSPSQTPELLAGKVNQPLKKGNLLLPEGFLSALGFNNPSDAVGQQIEIAVNRQINDSSLTTILNQIKNGGGLPNSSIGSNQEIVKYNVAAVVKKPSALLSGQDLNIYTSDQDVASLNDYINQGTANYHKYLSVNVKVYNGQDKANLDKVQAIIKAKGYGAQSVKDTQKFLSQIITVLQGIVLAFGLIAVIASVFGVVNTMYISVLQRTREIGLMKALGMRRRDISALFRYEAALLGFLGGLIGSISAVVIGILLNPWIANRLGLGNQRLLIFNYKQIIILIIILMLVATLAGLFPARKAAKLDPIEALRTE